MTSLAEFFRPNPSGEVSPSGDGTPPGGVDIEAAKAKIRGSSGGKQSKLEREAQERRQEQLLESLYAEENWEEVAALFFNVRYGMTGFEGFRLTDPQKKVLTSSTAALMRTLVQIDPRYVALVVWSVNYGSIIAQKEMEYKAVKRSRGNGGKAVQGAAQKP